MKRQDPHTSPVGLRGGPKPGSASQISDSGHPVFHPFDPEGQLRVYVRSLPHWRQPGATYFVTFRQDDSIPAAVLAEWVDTANRWYRAHALDPGWQRTDPQRFAAAYSKIAPRVRRAFEHQQARMLHQELDCCHGSCVLRHPAPRQQVADSMRFFHGQRLWMGDFTVMPNHVHAIMTPFEGWELEDLLGSIKKWTSRHINQWLGQLPAAELRCTASRDKGGLWQLESYDRIVRDDEELAIFRGYIADNAAKAKLCAGEYAHYVAEWLDAFAPRSRPA